MLSPSAGLKMETVFSETLASTDEFTQSQNPEERVIITIAVKTSHLSLVHVF
jgi:hypothetical protein